MLVVSVTSSQLYCGWISLVFLACVGIKGKWSTVQVVLGCLAMFCINVCMEVKQTSQGGLLGPSCKSMLCGTMILGQLLARENTRNGCRVLYSGQRTLLQIRPGFLSSLFSAFFVCSQSIKRTMKMIKTRTMALWPLHVNLAPFLWVNSWG